jgi:hypothetical protein
MAQLAHMTLTQPAGEAGVIECTNQCADRHAASLLTKVCCHSDDLCLVLVAQAWLHLMWRLAYHLQETACSTADAGHTMQETQHTQPASAQLRLYDHVECSVESKQTCNLGCPSLPTMTGQHIHASTGCQPLHPKGQP